MMKGYDSPQLVEGLTDDERVYDSPQLVEDGLTDDERV